MSEKVSYKKIDNHAESNGAKSPKTNGFETKFIWSWVPYERKFILILMIVCWIVVFTEYLLMNQRLANQIQGLTDGMFGFKKVIINKTLVFFIIHTNLSVGYP